MINRVTRHANLEPGLRKAVLEAAKTIGGNQALVRRAVKAFFKRAVWFPLKAGAESVALQATGDMVATLQRLSNALPSVETLRTALRAARYLSGLKRAEFDAALRRVPPDFFVTWVEQLKSGYSAARNAKQRKQVIQSAVDELNEILGLFHPDVVRRYEERAVALATKLRARADFNKRFSIVSDQPQPQILRFVKAPGVKGSKLPTRPSVDGLPVLLLEDKTTKVKYYLLLGDIQVKSSNVRELVVGENGRPGQLLRDAQRRRRDLDIAIFSPEGMTIPRERLIDATSFGVPRAEVSATTVGQRLFTEAERRTLRRRRIEALDVQHDVPTSISRDIATEVIKLLVPVPSSKTARGF